MKPVLPTKQPKDYFLIVLLTWGNQNTMCRCNYPKRGYYSCSTIRLQKCSIYADKKWSSHRCVKTIHDKLSFFMKETKRGSFLFGNPCFNFFWKQNNYYKTDKTSQDIMHSWNLISWYLRTANLLLCVYLSKSKFNVKRLWNLFWSRNHIISFLNYFWGLSHLLFYTCFLIFSSLFYVFKMFLLIKNLGAFMIFKVSFISLKKLGKLSSNDDQLLSKCHRFFWM